MKEREYILHLGKHFKIFIFSITGTSYLITVRYSTVKYRTVLGFEAKPSAWLVGALENTYRTTFVLDFSADQMFSIFHEFSLPLERQDLWNGVIFLNMYVRNNISRFHVFKGNKRNRFLGRQLLRCLNISFISFL
jgi:hypothetical protein